MLQAGANTLLRNPALYVTNNKLGYILAVSLDLSTCCPAFGTPATGFSASSSTHADAAKSVQCAKSVHVASDQLRNGCGVCCSSAILPVGGSSVWGEAAAKASAGDGSKVYVMSPMVLLCRSLLALCSWLAHSSRYSTSSGRLHSVHPRQPGGASAVAVRSHVEQPSIVPCQLDWLPPACLRLHQCVSKTAQLQTLGLCNCCPCLCKQLLPS